MFEKAAWAVTAALALSCPAFAADACYGGGDWLLDPSRYKAVVREADRSKPEEQWVRWTLPAWSMDVMLGGKVISWEAGSAPGNVDTLKFIGVEGERKRHFAVKDDGLYAHVGFVLVIR